MCEISSETIEILDNLKDENIGHCFGFLKLSLTFGRDDQLFHMKELEGINHKMEWMEEYILVKKKNPKKLIH